MAKFTAEDTHFVRIGGVADGSGKVYTFMTRPSANWVNAATSTASYALNSLVETKGASIKFLGTMTAAPSISVSLRQAGNATAALLRKKTPSSTVKSASTSAPIRLTRFVSKTDTVFHVTESAPFTVGVSYWVASQSFTIVSKPSGTTIEVSRPALGTYAAPIPIPEIRPTVHVHPATPKGLPVLAGVIDSAGNEEVRFRGFVDSVGLVNGTEISIGVRSVIQHLRDAPYTVPTAQNAPSPLVSSGDPSSDGGVGIYRDWELVEVDADDYGPSVSDSGQAWTRARWVGAGGNWVVTELEYVDTVEVDGRKIDRYSVPIYGGFYLQTHVHAYGKDGDIYDLDARKSREHAEAVFEELERVDWCHAYAYDAAPEWSEILLDLLTRDEPYASGVGIHSDYISGADANLPTVNLGLSQFVENTTLGFDAWVMPAMESKKWSDLFRDGFLRPTFRGLGVDEAARIKAFNWLEDPDNPRSVVSIGEEHLAGDASYKMTDQQIDARGVYQLDFGFKTVSIINRRGRSSEEEGIFEVIAISGDANQGALAQADEIKIPGTLAGSSQWRSDIKRYALDALDMFGISIPQLTFKVQPTVSVTPGQRVTVSRRDLPSRLGLVDTGSQTVIHGIVIGSGLDAGRINDLTIAVTGYADDPRPTRGTWAPIATVASWDSGLSVATIEDNAWTDSTNPEGVIHDVDPWQIVDYDGGETVDVFICTADLAAVGTATVTKATDAGNLSLSSSTLTPIAGHVLIPVSYDSQTSEALAAVYQSGHGAPVVHIAGSNGKLGAANNPGFGWWS